MGRSWGIVWGWRAEGGRVIERQRDRGEECLHQDSAPCLRTVNQWSQFSHFSSCFTVLTLQMPQGAVLDKAHFASASWVWPQPYLCTTLVHMVEVEVVAARTGES